MVRVRDVAACGSASVRSESVRDRRSKAGRREQSKAEHSKAEQSRAKQSRAEWPLLTAGTQISSSVPTPNSAVMSFGDTCVPIQIITCAPHRTAPASHGPGHQGVSQPARNAITAAQGQGLREKSLQAKEQTGGNVASPSQSQSQSKPAHTVVQLPTVKMAGCVAPWLLCG